MHKQINETGVGAVKLQFLCPVPPKGIYIHHQRERPRPCLVVLVNAPIAVLGLDGGSEDVHGALKAKLRDPFPRPAIVQAVVVVVIGYGLLNGLLAVSQSVERGEILFQLVMLLGILAGVLVNQVFLHVEIPPFHFDKICAIMGKTGSEGQRHGIQ